MMTDSRAGEEGTRPPVSVVVPFRGGAEAAGETIAALARLRLRSGDEVILADNSPGGVLPSPDPPMRVVRATAEPSSYYARNVGAEHAGNEWLLFIDADCRPTESLLDDYFALPVGRSVAALAGEIGAPDGGGLLARWARSRRILDQRASLRDAESPAGATANLLVRRSAWEQMGGFLEGVRSGADFEFCWRLSDAGWDIEFRPGATVAHVHRETLRAVARQMARYAAGNAWQNRRRPGSSPPFRATRALVRSVVGAAGYTVTGRFERGAMKAVDGVAALCQAGGRLMGNAAARRAGRAESGSQPKRGLVVATDRFPVPSETFVIGELEALGRLGWHLRVEAIARPARPLRGAARGLAIGFLEDEGMLERAAATAWLVCRHPARSAADLVSRRRWSPDERLPLSAIAPMARRLARGGERHVHVHFAALAAANALRAGRLLGVPVSVVPHGHEVFATPRALPAKLEQAAFVAAPCEYTARHVRGLMATGRDRVHTIVMGVDGERFSRRNPYPGGRTVVSVGRIVEKKGFIFLVEAAALLESEAPLERLVIAGDGPLRGALEQRAEELGIRGKLELPGQLSPESVRALLEEADLFAMPCVIASDGDRDAIPVAAKEALAMELPVVASEEVGLPELVEDGWGTLVRPGDADALAAGIQSLLSLPPQRRVEMGRAGRGFVLEHSDVRREASTLTSLIEEAARR